MSAPSLTRASESYVSAADNTAPSVPAAITGGQSPTEAEHNALRTTVADLIATLQEMGVLD